MEKKRFKKRARNGNAHIDSASSFRKLALDFNATTLKEKWINPSFGTPRSNGTSQRKFRYTADSAALCIIETLAK